MLFLIEISGLEYDGPAFLGEKANLLPLADVLGLEIGSEFHMACAGHLNLAVAPLSG